MKILVVKGSPLSKGTTALLADEFIRGAKENGNEVEVFDAGHAKLHPCLQCNYCLSHETECAQKDDMEIARKLILDSDVIVLVTPVYYFGMSSQIKMLIDRFFAFNSILLKNKKKSVLISACGDKDEWVPESLSAHYKTICRYLGWEDLGILNARGVYYREDIENTDYPEKAYLLGKSLKA